MMIAIADLANPDVQGLIAYHQRDLQTASPPGHSFALDLSGLTDPAVTVWAVWADDRVAAIGALKRLGGNHAELKSMRTHPDFLRRGIAAQLLETIIDFARNEGITRLSLETGSGPLFEPALNLYRNRGFVNGEAFGDYQLTEFNQCLHLGLG